MIKLLVLALSLALTENLALSRLLGIPPLLRGPHSLKAIAGLCGSVLFTTTFACLLSHLVYTLFLAPMGLTFLRLPVCLALSVGLLYLAAVGMRQLLPALHAALREHLPLTGISSAVLGCALLLTADGTLTLPLAPLYGFCAGLGYCLVLVLLTCLQERLAFSDCPKSFAGAPILLVTLALLGMAFSGFAGLNMW